MNLVTKRWDAGGSDEVAMRMDLTRVQRVQPTSVSASNWQTAREGVASVVDRTLDAYSGARHPRRKRESCRKEVAYSWESPGDCVLADICVNGDWSQTW
jgi:hypothetical protein